MFNYYDLSRRVVAAGYDGLVHHAIISVAVSLDRFDLDERQRSAVLDFISSEGRKQLDALPDRMLDAQWEDFNYGNVKEGDYVRVKPDAYDSEEGSLHNGLVGILVRGDARRYLVNYLGEHVGNSRYHPESSLQSLRWV